MDVDVARTGRHDRIATFGGTCAAAAVGCDADWAALRTYLELRLDEYRWSTKSTDDASLPVHVVCRACSDLLYARRGFPYYVSTVVAGLKATSASGRAVGVVSSFDALGSPSDPTQRVVASGRLVQSVLDDYASRERGSVFGSVAAALEAIAHAFGAAAARDDEAGTLVDVAVIRSSSRGVVPTGEDPSSPPPPRETAEERRRTGPHIERLVLDVSARRDADVSLATGLADDDNRRPTPSTTG